MQREERWLRLTRIECMADAKLVERGWGCFRSCLTRYASRPNRRHQPGPACRAHVCHRRRSALCLLLCARAGRACWAAGHPRVYTPSHRCAQGSGRGRPARCTAGTGDCRREHVAGHTSTHPTSPPARPQCHAPDLFLEDALEDTGTFIGRSSKWAKRGGKQGSGGSGGRATEGAGDGEGDEQQQENGAGAGQYGEQTRQSLAVVDESLVNTDLIEAVVAHVLSSRRKQQLADDNASAILIFAPGADEISRICRGLQASPRVLAAAGALRVLPLHGGLPPSQQTRVFDRPPRGECSARSPQLCPWSAVVTPGRAHCGQHAWSRQAARTPPTISSPVRALAGTVKIVVSTNVAETSITIDDVTCVIDTGRVKEMRFDASRGIARLQETFVSQVSPKPALRSTARARSACQRPHSRGSPCPAGISATAAGARGARAAGRVLPPLQPAHVGAHAPRHAAGDCARAAAGAGADGEGSAWRGR